MITVETVDLSILVEDNRNARKHDKKNLDAIRSSLIEFGQVEPLVVDRRNNVVIGGNGRIAVMRSLGWTQAVVAWIDNLTDVRASALGIALNRTSELATWDNDALVKLLTEIQSQDQPGTGFDESEIARIITAPALQEKPISPPPKVCWKLFAIPLSKIHLVAGEIEALGKISVLSREVNTDAG